MGVNHKPNIINRILGFRYSTRLIDAKISLNPVNLLPETHVGCRMLALVLQREILVSVHLENAILAKITG